MASCASTFLAPFEPAPFHRNPYQASVLGCSASNADESSLLSSDPESRSIDSEASCRQVTALSIVQRNKYASPKPRNPAKIVEDLRVMSLPRIAPFVESHPALRKALIAGLVSDPRLLRNALFSRRGIIVTTAVDAAIAEGDIGGYVLLETILADLDLVWTLVTCSTGNYALASLYNQATRPWKLRLHQLLMSRMEELSQHSMGNYVMVNVLSSYPEHQDDALMNAMTQLMLVKFQTLCLDKYASFVAVAWSQVLRPEVAQQVASSWLKHPDASHLFYRFSMSSVAHSTLINVFRPLVGTTQMCDINKLQEYVKRAKYAAVIFDCLRC